MDRSHRVARRLADPDRMGTPRAERAALERHHAALGMAAGGRGMIVHGIPPRDRHRDVSFPYARISTGGRPAPRCALAGPPAALFYGLHR